MTNRTLNIRGRKVAVAELGKGTPLVYLHGFADIHGAAPDFLPFHQALAKNFRVIAPAHPACAGSDEDEDIETMDDLVFHYLEVLDALKLERFALAGACVGGWIAAELATRIPERITRLALIGASGLYVQDKPIGDLFWEAQPTNGTEFHGFRALMFGDAESTTARALFPDRGGDIPRELARYKAMRFASRIGFAPPYFYNRKLRDRLPRYRGPALIVWGGNDAMVPIEHARAYADGFPKAKLQTIAGIGHSPQIEAAEQTAALIVRFMGGGNARPATKARPKAGKSKPAAKRRKTR
jgi:pimeloyl-ACP methyl ester carboxylesterase